MSQSGNTDSTSRFDITEFKNQFYNRYPRLSRVVTAFSQNPLSGNTLRLLIRGEEEITRDEREVRALQNPTMWEPNAPIVISQYGSYASDPLAKYWNATLPDLRERYGDGIRYEHHDVPVPNTSTTEYKLATIGRAIQHQAGNDAFWLWFNTIMVDGVQSVTDAYQLVEELDIDVDVSAIRDAVDLDLYGSVIWDDIYALMGKGNNAAVEEIEQQLESNEPVFAVFVNGQQVQPSYDSVVGRVEEVRAMQAQQQRQQQQQQQQQRNVEKQSSPRDPRPNR